MLVICIARSKQCVYRSYSCLPWHRWSLGVEGLQQSFDFYRPFPFQGFYMSSPPFLYCYVWGVQPAKREEGWGYLGHDAWCKSFFDSESAKHLLFLFNFHPCFQLTFYITQSILFLLPTYYWRVQLDHLFQLYMSVYIIYRSMLCMLAHMCSRVYVCGNCSRTVNYFNNINYAY